MTMDYFLQRIISNKIGPNADDERCPVCLNRTGNIADAADCCLFKHPTLTHAHRQEMVREIELGADWEDALRNALR